MSQTAVGAEAFSFKAAQFTLRDVRGSRANVSVVDPEWTAGRNSKPKVSQSSLEYI